MNVLVQQPWGNFPLNIVFFFFSLLIIDSWEGHYEIQVGVELHSWASQDF
jgi:hypothetical protein